jgi:molybdate transport system substrate-binding protein
MLLDASASVLVIAAASDLAGFASAAKHAVRDCEIRFSFGSSGLLARQIAAGADFDVYLSANERYVAELEREAHVLPETVTPYARGRLAVWSKRGLDWPDLGTAARISIANPAHAPYGVAARQALERRGLWESVSPRLVYGENVRQAWQFASTGNADATITAWSLVHDKGGRLVPESWHEPIIQAAAIPKRTRNLKKAKEFLNWLRSAHGAAALRGHGLDPAVSRTSRK